MRGKKSNLQKLMTNRKRPTLPGIKANLVAANLVIPKFEDEELNKQAIEYATWLGKRHQNFGPEIELDFDNPEASDWIIDVNADYQPTQIHFRKDALETAPRRLAYAIALGMGYGLLPAFAAIDEQKASDLLEQMAMAAGKSPTAQALFIRLGEIEEEMKEHEDNPMALRSRENERDNIMKKIDVQPLLMSMYLNWIIWEPNSPFRTGILQHLFDPHNTGMRESVIGVIKRNSEGEVINMSKEITDGFNRFHSNPILIWPMNEWQTIRSDFLKAIEPWLYQID